MLERRKHKRYKVNKNAFVFGANSPGRISDISIAGMAFSHICDGKESKPDAISILDSDNDFFLEQIPCQIISRNITRGVMPASSMQMAKVCVAFHLNSSQKPQLEEYINTKAIGNA